MKKLVALAMSVGLGILTLSPVAHAATDAVLDVNHRFKIKEIRFTGPNRGITVRYDDDRPIGERDTPNNLNIQWGRLGHSFVEHMYRGNPWWAEIIVNAYLGGDRARLRPNEDAEVDHMVAGLADLLNNRYYKLYYSLEMHGSNGGSYFLYGEVDYGDCMKVYTEGVKCVADYSDGQVKYLPYDAQGRLLQIPEESRKMTEEDYRFLVLEASTAMAYSVREEIRQAFSHIHSEMHMSRDETRHMLRRLQEIEDKVDKLKLEEALEAVIEEIGAIEMGEDEAEEPGVYEVVDSATELATEETMKKGEADSDKESSEAADKPAAPKARARTAKRKTASTTKKKAAEAGGEVEVTAEGKNEVEKAAGGDGESGKTAGIGVEGETEERKTETSAEVDRKMEEEAAAEVDVEKDKEAKGGRAEASEESEEKTEDEVIKTDAEMGDDVFALEEKNGVEEEEAMVAEAAEEATASTEGVEAAASTTSAASAEGVEATKPAKTTKTTKTAKSTKTVKTTKAAEPAKTKATKAKTTPKSTTAGAAKAKAMVEPKADKSKSEKDEEEMKTDLSAAKATEMTETTKTTKTVATKTKAAPAGKTVAAAKGKLGGSKTAASRGAKTAEKAGSVGAVKGSSGTTKAGGGAASVAGLKTTKPVKAIVKAESKGVDDKELGVKAKAEASAGVKSETGSKDDSKASLELKTKKEVAVGKEAEKKEAEKKDTEAKAGAKENETGTSTEKAGDSKEVAEGSASDSTRKAPAANKTSAAASKAGLAGRAATPRAAAPVNRSNQLNGSAAAGAVAIATEAVNEGDEADEVKLADEEENLELTDELADTTNDEIEVPETGNDKKGDGGVAIWFLLGGLTIAGGVTVGMVSKMSASKKKA